MRKVVGDYIFLLFIVSPIFKIPKNKLTFVAIHDNFHFLSRLHFLLLYVIFIKEALGKSHLRIYIFALIFCTSDFYANSAV